MTRFADRFRIESNRLIGWDYSNKGIYYVTICTRYKNNFFGKIVDGKMEYKKVGDITREQLLKTFQLRQNLNLIAWVVMPNHVHILFNVGDIRVETRCNASLIINNKKMTNILKSDNNLEIKFVDGDNGVRETRCNASLPGDSMVENVISNYRNHPGFYNKLNLKSNQEVSKIIREFKGAVKREANKQKIFFVW